MKRLTKDDIIEVVGTGDLKDLRELEILFLHCEELGAMHHCPKLLRLSVIDTGLKRLSNLAPLGQSLLTLCICDQGITKMENLDLPNLKELFLHRNQISHIEGLENCARLRRLWLFQNNISAVSGLHALPELEECWLQGNRIACLHGIENCGTLISLALGGNLISEYSELHRLSALNNLSSLALQDVHFGRCPIVDDTGYRNFCVCYLPQLMVLDGVHLTPDHQKVALLSHEAQVNSYNDRITVVENLIKAEIDAVDSKQQASKSHLKVLEKEMSEALRELEGLVGDGRNAMAKQVKKQKKIMDANFKVMERNIDHERNRAQSALNGTLASLQAEHDVAEALFCVLERATSSEIGLLEAFSRCSNAAPSVPRLHHHGRTSFAFQAIGEGSPEFLRMSSLMPLNHQFSGVPSTSLFRLFRTGRFLDSAAAVASEATECADTAGTVSRDALAVECYAILSLGQLQRLLKAGLDVSDSDGDDLNTNDPLSTIIFFTDLAVAVSLFSSNIGPAQPFCFGEYDVIPPLCALDNSSTKDASIGNMPSYKAARSSQMLLLVSCELNTAVLDLSMANIPRVRLPASTSARQEMYADLSRAKKPIAFEMEIPLTADTPPVSHVYSVPESVCHQEFACTSKKGSGLYPVDVKFVSICMTPILDGVVGIGGLKGLESKLELILTPSGGCGQVDQHSSNAMHHGRPMRPCSPVSRGRGGETDDLRQQLMSNAIISEFNGVVSTEVRNYLDRTLEEVTTETAESLLSADVDVESRSAAIRTLRQQIEKEREAQEALLKKMKSGDERGHGGHAPHHGHSSSSRSAGATQRDRSGYRR